MRAGGGIAKRAHHGHFDGWGNDVFPAAGLVMGLCPRKTEHVGKETFGETVATYNGFGKRVTIGK